MKFTCLVNDGYESFPVTFQGGRCGGFHWNQNGRNGHVSNTCLVDMMFREIETEKWEDEDLSHFSKALLNN